MENKLFSLFNAKDDKGNIYQFHLFDCYSVLEKINAMFPAEATQYAVNIGCGDGKSMNDPVYPIYTMGYGGLAIEGAKNEQLYVNLPQSAVKKIDDTIVTPYNIIKVLKENKCPVSCDFLKLDIDGYDGAVLKTILEGGYKPKVLQLEINPEIPFPISFSVLYDEKYRCLDKDGNVSGFYGLSLGYAMMLAEKYGYKLIQLDFVTAFTHDILLVRNDYLAIFTEEEKALFRYSPKEMFLLHPPGYSHFKEYGIQSLPWRFEQDLHKLAKLVWLSCLSANLRKHEGYAVPFHFSI